jgi:hypothetical protein
MKHNLTGGDFASRLIELCFNVIFQLEPAFEIVVNPFADRLDFLAWQFWNGCSDFLYRAHGESLGWKTFARNGVDLLAKAV